MTSSNTYFFPTNHPALQNHDSIRAYQGITTLRALFLFIAAYLLSTVTELGTNWILLGLAGMAGTIAGSRLAFSRLNFLGLLVTLTALALGFFLFDSLAAWARLPKELGVLAAANILAHLELIAFCVAVGFVSAFLFWRFSFLVTLEILALCLAAIYLFSGHRNYRFDTPQFINALAWSLGWGNLATLILIGSALVALVILYLFLSSLPARPLPHAREISLSQRGQWGILASGLLSLLFVAGYFFISVGLYRHYSAEEITRTASGVGQGGNEGLSPLGFHSALGSTNQPAALVRLEGDYNENPFVPFLYLREGALSAFSGKEMVIANSKYDTDLPNLPPETAFVLDPAPELPNRTPVVQSVYLLADHKIAFGLDLPLSLTRLKNPNTGRFRGTYLVKSIAPAYTLKDLQGAAVGSPDWDSETWKHYLEQHHDPRYADMAKRITADAVSPVHQAFLLAEYLTENSIYTLSPNHDVAKDQDPVEPYLFGDMRGYCVHFAHAMVYMLRAVGLPARIATGYLTDYSQAKDGHILLRMSDRHAWAEVYLTEFGWVPFDVQPHQVESHADSQVDSKLLEELMGLLEPEEEILPKEILKDEANIIEQGNFLGKVLLRIVLLFLVLAALTLVFVKVVILNRWRVSSSKEAQVINGTEMLIAMLYDLGIRRSVGETRSEFRQRLMKDYQLKTLQSSELLVKARYSGAGAVTLEDDDVLATVRKDLTSLNSHFGAKRWLAYIRPGSVFAKLSGGLS